MKPRVSRYAKDPILVVLPHSFDKRQHDEWRSHVSELHMRWLEGHVSQKTLNHMVAAIGAAESMAAWDSFWSYWLERIRIRYALKTAP